MFRSFVSAMALAGLLTASAAFADPAATTASDHSQTATAAKEQPAAPASVWAAPSDAAAPAGVGHGKESPVGFGWG